MSVRSDRPRSGAVLVAGVLSLLATIGGAARTVAAAAEPAPAPGAPPWERTLDPTVGGHVSPHDSRSSVVMPEQRIDVRFSHERHIVVMGLECADCHVEAAESTATRDYLVPAREQCLDCHDSTEIPWTWGPKWKRDDNAIAIPPAHLRFSHERHLAVADVDCETCHAGVGATDLATREHLPSMETCLSCHDGAAAPGSCDTCHPTGSGGRLRTTFDSGVLVPDDHGPGWLKEHEVAAERDLAQCASCHAQEECISCHDGVLPPRFHDGDYLALHVQDAYANSPPCASCHRAETFCADCHFRAQVVIGNPLFPTLEGNFHPAGWNAPEASGATHHAWVARKNLAACAACHEPQRDCIGCHAWFPGAPSTHGPGFATSDRARRLRRNHFDLCLQCHTPAFPEDPINRMP